MGSVPSLPEGDAGGGGTAAGQEGRAGQARAAAPGSRSSTWQHVPRAWGAAAPPAPTSKAPEQGVVRTALWFTEAKPGLQGPVLPLPVEPSLPSPSSTASSQGGSKHGANAERGWAGGSQAPRGSAGGSSCSLLLLLQLSLHSPHAASSAGCPAHGPHPCQLHRGSLGAAGGGSGGCPCSEGALYAVALRGAGASRSSQAAGERCCRPPHPEPLIHGSLLDAEEHVCFCFPTFVHSPPEVCGSVSPSSFCELKELEKMVSEVKDVLFSEN